MRPLGIYVPELASRGGIVRQVLEEATAPLSRLVVLPGRGVMRVWECAGPPGADTLVLIHGVAATAELNWGRVLAPLGCHFRVVAPDLRGHGDGIPAGGRFRLEACADRIAAAVALLRADPVVPGGRLPGRRV